jgi:hypothetical protein
MFNTISIKIPMTFPTKIEKNSKVHVEAQKKPQIAKAIPRKRAILEASQYSPLTYTTEPYK